MAWCENWPQAMGLYQQLHQAYLGAIWILCWLQKFILRYFPFNTQQIVFLHIIIFSFYMFWYRPLCALFLMLK
jgi:hypothetical protein